MPDVQVPVLECGFDADARGRVEGEHLVEQIEGVGVGLGEEPGEGDFVGVWEVADVFLGAGGTNAGEGFFVGSAEEVQDLVELVDVVTAFEEGTAAEEFG